MLRYKNWCSRKIYEIFSLQEESIDPTQAFVEEESAPAINLAAPPSLDEEEMVEDQEELEGGEEEEDIINNEVIIKTQIMIHNVINDFRK